MKIWGNLYFKKYPGSESIVGSWITYSQLGLTHGTACAPPEYFQEWAKNLEHCWLLKKKQTTTATTKKSTNEEKKDSKNITKILVVLTYEKVLFNCKIVIVPTNERLRTFLPWLSKMFNSKDIGAWICWR